MAIDVRSILDCKVWPQDVHDFVGDVVDILDEQLEPLDQIERRDAANQVLSLLGDDDLVIRSWAVLSLRRVVDILGIDQARDAVDSRSRYLTVAPPDMWRIQYPTLLEEANYRLTST